MLFSSPVVFTRLSAAIGVSPWYWWADVPTTKQSQLFVSASGCSHGSPSVKYRGIFLNDEQPALQSWAQEKFTNGTGAPFNHLFYSKVSVLLHLQLEDKKSDNLQV